MNRVIFVGDTHGKWNVIPDFINEFNITDTTFIQVGDFGLGFDRIATDVKNTKDLNKVLKNTNNELLVIRGNHDHPGYWLDAVDWNLSNFTLVPDYTQMIINDKKYLFVGGGTSIDRSVRTVGRTYWISEGIKIKEPLPTEIDILVTHVPYPNIHQCNMGNLLYWKIQDNNLNLALEVENLNLIRLAEVVRPSYWVAGHLHVGRTTWHEHIKHVSLGIDEFKELESFEA